MRYHREFNGNYTFSTTLPTLSDVDRHSTDNHAEIAMAARKSEVFISQEQNDSNEISTATKHFAP